ncbi:MAG: hypothetical protein AB1400_11670 [Pseudomonadota bacterium]|jgi:hypothetical protein
MIAWCAMRRLEAELLVVRHDPQSAPYRVGQSDATQPIAIAGLVFKIVLLWLGVGALATELFYR